MKKGREKDRWSLELGANMTYQGIRFRVWAPKARSVSLRVTGEPDDIPMIAEPNGYFTAFLVHRETGTRYSYVLDENRIRPDPVSRFQPEGVHGPSEVVDAESFQWEDQGWKGIRPEEMIFYEIHTGAFTREGTFQAVLPLLNYLKFELGVTALELMPVAQFPGERNWGYDGTYLYAPQNSYGGPHGLKSLVNACHKIGLAVILDVVYNHLGPEGNYLNDFGPYFTDRYKTPWGPAVNFDGPESDEVRKFIINNALYWVTEYHIDGLRADAIHGIFDFSARHILHDLREVVHHQAKRLERQIAVIAESDLNDTRIVDPPAKGGHGLDAQWDDDFHHCLHTLLTKEKAGYYEDFGNVDQMAQALREGFVYNGQYSSFRRRQHGNSSKHLPPKKFVVFSQNHDQVGNRAKGDRLGTLISFEAQKLAAGVVFLSPYLPLLFMGEEYGEEAPFQYFVSHSDPELIEAVRRGRREEFSAFGWEGEIPDPQDIATFLRSKVDHHLRTRGNKRCLFEFYGMLIKLRKEVPSLSHPTREGMEIDRVEGKRILFLGRQYGEDEVFCLFNFDEMPAEINRVIKEGNWQKILDSSAQEWGGMGGLAKESIPSSGSKISFVLDAYNVVLYRRLSPFSSPIP